MAANVSAMSPHVDYPRGNGNEPKSPISADDWRGMASEIVTSPRGSNGRGRAGGRSSDPGPLFVRYQLGRSHEEGIPVGQAQREAKLFSSPFIGRECGAGARAGKAMRLVHVLCAFAVVFALTTTLALATPQPAVCASLNPALASATTGTSSFGNLLNEALADRCVAEVNDGADLYAQFITSPMLGQVITIGAIGADLTDIALAPSGQLYGIDTHNDLYTINQDTGVATLVGPVGYGLVGLVVSSDGTIYGSGGKRLVVINPTTGSGTPV